MNVGGNNFYLGNKKVIAYDTDHDTTSISGAIIDFGGSSIKVNGEVLIGQNKTSGVFISPSVIQIHGSDVYHAGNANLEHIDWVMRNAKVTGTLSVKGMLTLQNTLNANYGVNLGSGGKTLLPIIDNEAVVKGNMSFTVGNGIKIDDAAVLIRPNETDIQLGAVGGYI